MHLSSTALAVLRPPNPLSHPCRHRADLAAQQEEQRREQLAGRLAAKEAKVAAMEAEKAHMKQALECVRKEIAVQEHQLR